MLFIRRDVTQTFHASLVLIGASISHSWQRLRFVVEKMEKVDTAAVCSSDTAFYYSASLHTPTFTLPGWPLCWGSCYVSDYINRVSSISIVVSSQSTNRRVCASLCHRCSPGVSLILPGWVKSLSNVIQTPAHARNDEDHLISALRGRITRPSFLSLFICKILGFLFVSLTPLFFSLTLSLSCPTFPSSTTSSHPRACVIRCLRTNVPCLR